MNDINKIAEDYHGSEFEDKFIEDESQFYTLNWLKSQLNKDDSVLEMGYGEGIVTDFLNDLNINLDVIEGAKQLVEKATARFSDISFIYSMFEDYKPKKKYDVILCTHVLEHVNDPVEILKLMRSWLSENGKIVVIVPNAESIHRQLSVIMGIQDRLDNLSKRDLLVGHQRVYDYKLLENHISQANFKIKEKKGFFLKTLPNSMMLKFDIKLIKALNSISEKLPFNVLANLAYVITK
jgi:2-polyprenyl-3-methyl-5-hydroxy-6-metoxy-1,4-benzoquinol methylase